MPWLAKVVGLGKRQPMINQLGKITTACAEAMVRVAFVPSAVCRFANTGVRTILRVRTFFVRLVLGLQSMAFAALVSKMEAFRESCSQVVQSGGSCTTVLAVSYSWDETKQMLRDLKVNALQRQAGQRVSRSILVQRCMVYATASVQDAAGSSEAHSRAEALIIPPLEVCGKTTQYLLAAFRKAFPLPLFETDRLRELMGRISALILGFSGDSASTNRRFLKHLVGAMEEVPWPDNILVDPGQVCLLHQIHRVKVQIVEVHNLVSLMYCLSKLVRAGSVTPLISDYVAQLVQNRCVRRVGPPPPGANEQARRTLDMIFRLDASHHKHAGKKGVGTSRLVKDALELLKMDNGGFLNPGTDLVHHCWDGQGPCCASLADTKDKMTAAYLNLFVCHSMPVATLSRWTHIQTVCSILCCGFACRDIFVQALAHGLNADDKAEAVAVGRLDLVAAGAGDDDRATEYRARVAKVRQWLLRATTRVHVACLFMMLRIAETVSYYLMGGDKSDDARNSQPGTIPRSESPRPVKELIAKVRDAMVQFASSLVLYEAGDSECAFFLRALGATEADINSDHCIRIFRRYMVGASVGFHRRLNRRLHAFPYKLWLLVEPGVPHSTRQACAEEFSQLPSCCLGVFGRCLKKRCPNSDALLSHDGRTIVKAWLDSVQWSIYACEKEHASCRRLCEGTGPGRNWSLVARERVAEQVRAAHKQMLGMDPAACPVMASSSRKRDARAVSPSASLEAAIPEGLTNDAIVVPNAAIAWPGHTNALVARPERDDGGEVAPLKPGAAAPGVAQLGGAGAPALQVGV